MRTAFATWPAQEPQRSMRWSSGGNPPDDHAVDVMPVETTAPISNTFLRGMSSLIGAAGVALLLPLFIVGLPLALVWRAVLEMTVWRGEARYADDP